MGNVIQLGSTAYRGGWGRWDGRASHLSIRSADSKATTCNDPAPCSLTVGLLPGCRPSGNGVQKSAAGLIQEPSFFLSSHPPCLGSRLHPGTCSCTHPAAAGGAGRRHSVEEEAERTPGTEQ
ncbi:unnamed protein product [Lepidochelys kempii]